MIQQTIAMETYVRRSFNYLTRMVDADGLPYFNVFASRPAVAAHDWPDFGDVMSRQWQAAIMARTMTGEELPMELVPYNIPVFTGSQTPKGAIRRLPYPYGSGGSANLQDQDKSTRVRVDPAAPGAKLALGDLIRATVVLESREDVLWLPPQAVREFEGRKFVVVQDGDVQRRIDIKIGIIGEDRVEIQQGVTEGQVVLTQ